MNHIDGYKVTIIQTERWTLTRSIKQEVRIEPLTRANKNTATAATVSVLVEIRQDAGNHKAQDVD